MKKFLLVCFSFCFALSVWAQERVITGRVTSADDGSALPGVNVVVKGTTNGTVTDSDGKYSLSIPSSNAALIYSFIGLKTTEVVVGERTVVDVQLGLDVTQLSEVVVTAQGVERDKKALGYASTTVTSADFANKPETDIGRSLQGRTPGLQILNSSGLAGSGSKINIRGISSVSGDSQPLWVVDGVPINTSTNDSNTDFRDGNVAPSRFLDLDPNSIESMSILRGLSATTLYGSQGRNGVILVTTKGGSSSKQKDKFEGGLSQSYFVNEAVVPELQNKWGNGFDGDYGEFFSNWGSVFDGTARGRHPYYEWRTVFPDRPEFNDLSGYVPKAAPDNVSGFFRKGITSTTSLNLGLKGENSSLNFSYSHLDQSGYIKNNNLIRDNFSLGGTANLTKKLSITSVFNFVRTDVETPPTGAGLGNNSTGGPSVFANLFFTPRNIDLMNWPYQNPNDGSNVYFRNNNSITNPRWLLDNSRQTSKTDRFFSNFSIDYQLTDWFKLTYRLGLDTYTEKSSYWLNKGSVGYPTDAALLSNGLLRSIAATNTILDHTALGTITKKLNSDFSFTGLIGANLRTDTYVQNGLESTGQVVFGVLEHRNFQQSNSRDYRQNNLNYQSSRTWVGAYFDAGFDFKNFLYLNLTGRNDWSSTHEAPNRSLFYPGGSVSFIPTAAFPSFGAGIVDFLKVRFAYGTSANFAIPYQTRPYVRLTSPASVDGLGSVTTLSTPIQLANKDLRPELLTEIEAGLEAYFLDSKIKLDLSVYRREAKDQILNRSLDPSTGYQSTQINAGSVSNEGIEIGLTVTPIKTEDLLWTVRGNFTKNISKVESLPEGSKRIQIAGFPNLGNFAVEGRPFNVIYGNYIVRNANGQKLVDGDGNYVISPEIGEIADPNPQFLASLINTVSYKGLSLNVQVDYVGGGSMFSGTAGALTGRGVLKSLENFDPGLPLILPGVKETDGTPNDVVLTTAGVYFGNSIVGSSLSDVGIYDATRMRLREVSLSYTLPSSILSKYKIRAATISLTGNNLWWRAFNTPESAHVDFDRTAFGASNGAGFEFLGGPSARSYGATLKLTF